MLTYGFYNSKNGDRKYDANQFSGLFDGILKDGIFRSIGDCFKVSADEENPGMTILVGTGRAWFNNTWTLNDAILPLTVEAADSSNRRIDYVVLEVNKTDEVRKNTIKIIKGTPAESPVAPELMNGDGIYQYPLASITVEAATTVIVAEKVYNMIGLPACPYAEGLNSNGNAIGNGAAVTRNSASNVAEMLNVAKTYYDVRGTSDNPTFLYGSGGCLDTSFDPSDADSARTIDCSTFIGLILRGITAQKSPYSPVLPESDFYDETEPPEDNKGGNTSTDGSSGGAAFLAENDADYAWAMNLNDISNPITPLSDPVRIRTASQLAQWMEESGRAIPLRSDFSNVEPGDIIFWAKTDDQGKYVRQYRYRNISHVAMCYSKLPQPDDATVGLKVGVDISVFNSSRALSWLEAAPRSINTNTIYQVLYLNGNWYIRKRSEEKDSGTKDYTWEHLDSTYAWVSDNSAEQPIQLSYIGVTAAVDPNAEVISFRLTQYYWERDKYPYKHTMMEVTSVNPVVLNRTLEKNRPEEVVLICRPDLGAVGNDETVGNLNTLYGRTEIDTLFRQGTVYLTSDISININGKTVSGQYKMLKVDKTMTSHGKPYSIIQTLLDVNTFGGFFKRTQYCYDHAPNASSWSEWRWFPAALEVTFSGSGINTTNDVSFSKVKAAYASGCKISLRYIRNKVAYDLISRFTVNDDGELIGIVGTYFEPRIDSGAVRQYTSILVDFTSTRRSAIFEEE